MPEHHPGDLGGTMRLGKRKTVFQTDNSVLRQLYSGAESVEERHRHRYEVNPELVHHFEEKGMHFVGHDTEGKRMEILELEGKSINHGNFLLIRVLRHHDVSRCSTLLSTCNWKSDDR